MLITIINYLIFANIIPCSVAKKRPASHVNKNKMNKFRHTYSVEFTVKRFSKAMYEKLCCSVVVTSLVCVLQPNGKWPSFEWLQLGCFD